MSSEYLPRSLWAHTQIRMVPSLTRSVFSLSRDNNVAEETQKRSYYPGVGQDKSGTSRARAGAIGDGCEDIIMDVYKECCDTLSPSDELWLYGFSRGAYIVRAVAALFARMGALNTDVIQSQSKPTTFEQVYRTALKFYEAQRDDKTGGPVSNVGMRLLI